MGASLSNIVSVSVSVSNPSLISSNFNLGLIVGDSGHLTSSKQIEVYSKETYSSAMIADGFVTTDPEYKAVVEYFSQNPKPAKVAVADILSETPEVAIATIRNANDKWYNFCFAVADPATTLTDTVIKAVAAAVESFSVPTIFHFASSDEKCVQSNTENIFKALKTSGYKKTFGWYDTSESKMTVPGVIGVICGLNSMDTNSAYTLAYKSIIGADNEELTDIQLANLAGYNGNAYTAFGSSYKFIYPAISFGEYHADELYLIDVASYLIQQEAVAGLTSSRVIPQTEDGVAQLITFISSACETLREMSVIASGIWTGDSVLDLHTGDAIEGGYYIQSGKISDQSVSDRLARKSPPIYVALKSAGAIEHVVIAIYVNR